MIRVLSIILSCLLINQACLAQDTKKKTDREMNNIKVLSVDTSKRVIIPARMEPASKSVSLMNKADSIKQAKTLISRSVSQIHRGDYGMAIFNISEAINVCPQDDIKTMAIAISYYALVDIKISKFASASKKLNQCDTLFRKIGDLSLFAFHYNNMGQYYLNYLDEERSKDYFLKALSINRQLGNSEGIATTLNNLGQGIEDPEAKIEYLNEAISINKKLGREITLAENYNSISKLYLLLGKNNLSLDYINEGAKIATKHKSNKLLFENDAIMADYYASIGNYKSAYTIKKELDKKMAYSSRNLNISSIEQIIHSRALSKKQYQLDLKSKEYRIKILNVYLYIALCFIFLILLSSYSIIRISEDRRKIKELALKHEISEKELIYANNEIVSMATYLSSRNEILQSIQQNLSRILKLPDGQANSEIRKVNMYIRNLQAKNQEVDNIFAKMNQINESFIDKLTFKHPEITKNDKNIALLLRANLTTKQIATLLDCSPKSVNMARYRLRIHLNLDNELNLVNYLKEL